MGRYPTTARLVSCCGLPGTTWPCLSLEYLVAANPRGHRYVVADYYIEQDAH